MGLGAEMTCAATHRSIDPSQGVTLIKEEGLDFSEVSAFFENTPAYSVGNNLYRIESL